MKKNRKRSASSEVEWEEGFKTPENFQLLLTVLRSIINNYNKPSFSPFISYSNPTVFIDGDSPAEQNSIICSA